MDERISFRTISVVIPVFNEEENLRPLYTELANVSARVSSEYSFEFIFVDDGSRDASISILRELAAADSRVKIAIFNRNTGQTAAMSCGIALAKGEVIVPMDADLQNDPADIPKLLAKMKEGYSCVSGWRKDRKDALVLRKIPSWMANSIISWMTGVHLHDYGCSLKAYSREIIQDTPLYGEMHRFIPAYVAWSGGRVTEMAVNHRARIHGVSKYGISRVFKVVLDLLVVKFLTRYFNKPMHFFGAVGMLSLVLGVVAELVAVYYKLAHLKDFVQTPLPIIGAMFLIVGFQFVLFGIMSEVLMRTYYEGQGKTPYTVKERINF